jgi:PAS domain S-box-containing protein
MIDHQGSITFWNEASFNIFGYTKEEALGKNLHDLIAPKQYHDQFKKVFPIFQATGHGAAIGEMVELTALRKDGTEIPIELSLSAINLNHQWHAVGIIHDITRRKEIEENVKRERILLRTLIDILPDTIYVKDKEARKIIANPADLKIMGYAAEADVIGKTDLDMFDPKTGMRGYDDDMSILREHQPAINHEENFIDHDGNERWLLTSKVPLCDESGNVVGLVGIGRDITERRKSELQLARQAEELKELNATKDKFFSIIAHDLRSPFNAFLGMTKMMEEDFPSMTQEEIFQFIQMMGVSANNLYRLLENLLEWSQLQRGVITVNPMKFHLLPVVQKSMELIRELANNKGIEILLLIPPHLEVFADEKMLDATLRNLSSNAVKFTPQGGKITIVAAPSKNNFVAISIMDTGIGIPPDMMDDLFKIDVNTNRSGTEGEPSSGLGLILCKEFVERNGGRLWVNSEDGRGATFNFTLPVDETGFTTSTHPDSKKHEQESDS